MIVSRGDNRFKVRVLRNDGIGYIFLDFNVESFGFNFVIVDKFGIFIIILNRYVQIYKSYGKVVKLGGNIVFYGLDGYFFRRIINEDFYVNFLEKFQMVVVDEKRSRIYVVDLGSYKVIVLNFEGGFVFEYGNIEG